MNEEKIVENDINTFLMGDEQEQIFEHRKKIWDKGQKKYKERRVDMKGHLIKDKVESKSKGPSLGDQFKKWKRKNLLGFQKEGEQENQQYVANARNSFAKRSQNRFRGDGSAGAGAGAGGSSSYEGGSGSGDKDGTKVR